MAAKCVAIVTVLQLFFLGLEDASLLAIPLGGTLFWLLVIATESSLDGLPTAGLADSRNLPRFVLGSVVRCILLAAGDFELGRLASWLLSSESGW